MRNSLLVLLLVVLALPSFALIDKDLESFDKSLMSPPETMNEDLNKRVNFSFKEIDLSEILVLLSKVGKFNVVLPEDLDRKVSIIITDQKVIEAIDDISDLTGLNYTFKGNSLVFSNTDIKGMKFVSVPIVYYNADDIVKALNDELFKQFEISQNKDSIKAYATKDPTKNSVILFGNEEHITAAKNFIKELDSNPTVKIFTPTFLSFQDVKKLTRAYFTASHRVNVKRYETKSVLIKGSDKEVEQLLVILKKHDVKPEPIDIVVEVYSYQMDMFQKFKDSDILPRLKLTIVSNESEIDSYQYLKPVQQHEFKLGYDDFATIKNVNIQAKRNPVDPDSFNLRVYDNDGLDQINFITGNDSYGYFYFTDRYLKKSSHRFLKSLSTRQGNHVVVMLFKLKNSVKVGKL